jgi:hypothetical protein
VEDVRDKRQCGRLTQEQLYLLDIAGFDATVKEAAGGESNRTWEMWFDELVEYKNVVGSCEVPENRADAGLGLWVERQRRKHAEGTLPEKALARLLALGVSFEGYEPTPAKATSKAKAKTGAKANERREGDDAFDVFSRRADRDARPRDVVDDRLPEGVPEGKGRVRGAAARVGTRRVVGDCSRARGDGCG